LEFHAQYVSERAHYEAAAELAREVVARALRDAVGGVAVVQARAKDTISLLDKLRRKEYANPARQVTDLVGVRVITAYPDEAAEAAEILRGQFFINDDESSDKLDLLAAGEFGYRAIHLIAKLRSGDEPSAEALRGMWFEIQVRSFLQHAWAEVEHEVVYKSGMEAPRELKRRFSALAGALEMSDHAFIALRGAQADVVARYAERYRSGDDADTELDAARLAGVLEVLRPHGQRLWTVPALGAGPAASLPKILCHALHDAGVQTASQLKDALRQRKVAESLKSHASQLSVVPDDLSHAIVGIVVIWNESQDVLEQYPELRFDAELAETLGFDISPLAAR
jgi:ppGpp synthetase/RelA/SpoT-type nucleotidyltranferase